LPKLIALLDPLPSSTGPNPEFDEVNFVPASDALQEIMASSAFASGTGSKTVTEPLLLWLDTWGGHIVRAMLEGTPPRFVCLLFMILTTAVGMSDATSHSLCKLLVALGDHSTSYLATNLSSPLPVSASSSYPSLVALGTKTRAQLVQAYLQLVLGYTSLPGWYGVDEDESELMLGFWYLFQEALWAADYDEEEDDFSAHSDSGRAAGSGFLKPPGSMERASSAPVQSTAGLLSAGSTATEAGGKGVEQQQWAVARAVYAEAVKALRKKVVWPPREVLSGWTKDAKDKFKV
jgi:hypothetical protein